MLANSFTIIHILFLCLLKSNPVELDWGLEISKEAEEQMSQEQSVSFDSTY